TAGSTGNGIGAFQPLTALRLGRDAGPPQAWAASPLRVSSATPTSFATAQGVASCKGALSRHPPPEGKPNAMNRDLYSDRAKQAVQSAQSLALARRHQQFAPEHLLKVLLE